MDKQLKEAEGKADKICEGIDTVKKIAKHKQLLQRCNYYLSIIAQIALSQQLFDEARKFANDTYSEIQKDAWIIAMSNTSTSGRIVDVVTNLKLDLEALTRMLVETLTKEGVDIINDIKDAYQI
ncbi:MAG: hypothetical protein NC240_01030 [Clostridium sp.]|nr:hypothetical protein [Clostridium sp.]